MTTIQNPKNPKYYCEYCQYITCNKKDYNKHILTIKHKNNVSQPSEIPKIPKKTKKYICEICEKIFNDRAGLWRHKKRCSTIVVPVEQKNDISPELITLITELVKGQQQLQESMMKVLENGTNNIYNNTNTTNSHNKAFNLNFFLNETCKDAMNIMDFVESIQLQVTDLERIGEIGYVEGISDIIVSNLNKLDVTQRPIHCTDKKRETMYVKDAGKWEKDENTDVIRRAIRKVTHNNQRLLPKFREKYPDYHNSYSSHSDKVTKVIIETMVNNVPDKEDKIIRNIAKSVVLDKIHSL